MSSVASRGKWKHSAAANHRGEILCWTQGSCRHLATSRSNFVLFPQVFSMPPVYQVCLWNVSLGGTAAVTSGERQFGMGAVTLSFVSRIT